MEGNLDYRELLARVFDEAQEGLREDVGPKEYEKRKADFVFHMTDWTHDIDVLQRLRDHPETTTDEATTSIIGFLYHVIPHLNAAGRLLLDEVPDPFGPSTRGPLLGAGQHGGREG